MSALASTIFSPIACSGLMYCGVPSESPVCVMRALPALLHRQRDSEIRHERVIALQKDVLGFYVAMNDPLRMCRAERVGNFARDAYASAYWKLTLALEPRAERLSLDVRHDIVQQSVGVSGIKQREDVRVLKLRSRLDLAEEPFASERGSELGVQNLDGDVAIVFDVVGEIHGSHTARPELTLDAVLVR
jgi:hypothetical protein